MISQECEVSDSIVVVDGTLWLTLSSLSGFSLTISNYCRLVLGVPLIMCNTAEVFSMIVADISL